MAKAKRKSASHKKGEDPCWEGYEQAGTKKKGNKKVPNCIPSKPKKK
jgi:hypothetical protein